MASAASALPDPSSFSNSHEVRLTSFDLNLTVDFKQQVLHGHALLHFKRLKDNVTHVTLDTRDLNITAVDLADGKNKLQFEFGEANAALGTPLRIAVPQHLPADFVVRIHYSTSPASSAIQWLSPSQTAGKQHPYMFTQCQAIHCRSVMPTQDTPGVKCPYTASLTVDKPLVALMSALSTDAPASTHASSSAAAAPAAASATTTTFHFKQPVPIPAYLLAIAVGALEKRDIGPRSAVWSEKEMVEKGAYEFADTEKFIQAAEGVCGPYVWGRYDILLLPPSFPYGGMENPCLTFVTPTLLAGDRSLANVVAHEIAHSWMGNLVSPKTWEHFWLNEGFTVFVERKIVRAVWGPADQHLHAILGVSRLRDSVDQFGATHAYTRLVLDLKGVDPDDSFSTIPYEKGFNFLFYLESLVGGEEIMAKFLTAHCDKFKFQSIDSYEWKEFFLSYFQDKVSADVLNKIDWELWYKGVGMPPVENKFDTTLVSAAHQLAADVADGKGEAKEDLKQWSSNQLIAFLDRLMERQQKYLSDHADSKEQAQQHWLQLLTKLDQKQKLSASRNSEVRFRWCTLGIKSELKDAMTDAVAMLKEQGRMKFVRPLYRALFASTGGKQLALDTFASHRTSYHNICAKMVAKDLGVDA